MAASSLSTGKKLLYSTLVLLIVILAMEFTLRIKYALDQDNWTILISPLGKRGGEKKASQTAGPQDFLYSTEKSYTYFNTHEQKNYTINITKQGFFYPSLLEKDDTSTCRIFCIGGSSTYGGQSYDETWPGYLESCLRGRFPDKKVEVINFGQPGVGLLEILDRVKKHVLDYNPDLIIYYGGYNDADKPDCLGTARLGRRLVRGIEQVSETMPLLVHIHNALHRRWSYLYTYLLEKYELIKYIYATGYVDIAGYSKLLEELADICRKRGISLVLVSQVLDQPDYPAGFESIEYSDSTASKAFYARYCGNERGNHDVWITFRQRILIKLQKDFCRRHGLQYIELRDEFKNADIGGADKFYDIVHLSSRANDLLAGIVCRELNTSFLESPDRNN